MSQFISQPSLSFDDVILVPQYSDIRSRSEIDMSVKLTDDLVLTLQ